ncbi:hypothetical protein HRR86_006064 [Exophiala dermatitidis]|nr:hypothetical protein HRR86_006064 [Exophiala dermatitidis]
MSRVNPASRLKPLKVVKHESSHKVNIQRMPRLESSRQVSAKRASRSSLPVEALNIPIQRVFPIMFKHNPWTFHAGLISPRW